MELPDDEDDDNKNLQINVSGKIETCIKIQADCIDGTELLLPLDLENSESQPCDEMPSVSVPPTHSTNKIKIQNILDKSISIDDDNLITPLQPEKLPFKINAQLNLLDISAAIFPPILKKCADNEDLFKDTAILRKRVSFPEKVEELFSYKEPKPDIFPFVVLEKVSPQELATIYKNSCSKNNTLEIKSIANQILEIKNNTNRTAELKLSNLNVTYEVLETLEDLFRVSNFNVLWITDCTFSPATIAVLFDLLEYYECTTQLILSIDLERLDAWKFLFNFISKTVCVEALTFKSMSLSDATIMKALMNSINANENIKSLNFDNCMLIKLPNFTLIEYLESNYTIRELCLPQTGLFTREADMIGKLLKRNFTIQILDISNNRIGDRGLEHLARGLCQQTNMLSSGLSALIVFNNQITEKSGKTINSIITNCKNLRTLNVGYNNLTDTAIGDMVEGLRVTRTLQGLGLQATVLTCKGAALLAEAITQNKSLEKINLKGNKAIFIEGLEKLSRALINSKIFKVELDETNRSYCGDLEEYKELVKKIKEICTINKSLASGGQLEANTETVGDYGDRKKINEQEEEEEQEENEDEYDIGGKGDSAFRTKKDWSMSIMRRKVSLNCEPYYNIQNSPNFCVAANPSPRSRFSVSKVIDTVPISADNRSSPSTTPIPLSPVPNPIVVTKSRFKVVAVPNLEFKSRNNEHNVNNNNNNNDNDNINHDANKRQQQQNKGDELQNDGNNYNNSSTASCSGSSSSSSSSSAGDSTDVATADTLAGGNDVCKNSVDKSCDAEMQP